MTEIFNFLGRNTITIVTTLLVLGFLAYMFMNSFKREIRAYLKKKFDLYDGYEVVSFARHFAEKTRKSTFNYSIEHIYEQLKKYKDERK